MTIYATSILLIFAFLFIAVIIKFIVSQHKRIEFLEKLLETQQKESINSLNIILSYTSDSMPNNTQLVVKSLCNREIERLNTLYKTP
jgi:hypothetical protein